jgi:hypothetical protein
MDHFGFDVQKPLRVRPDSLETIIGEFSVEYENGKIVDYKNGGNFFIYI